MEAFNKTHVELITQRIKNGGINNEALAADLLDHYCCIVEEEMSKGKPFEVAYRNAWNSINPGGLNELEEELFFLIHLNKQITMNRLKYLGGFFAATFIAVGFLFYILHWPGGKAISIMGYGSLLFTCIFMLVMSFKKYGSGHKQEKFRLITGNLTGIFIATGSLFKAFWFPGANILLVTGFFILVILYLPAFFYHSYKRSVTE